MKISHRMQVAGVAVAALILGAVGFAWACTPNADIHVEPASGEAGSTVTVSGSRFIEGRTVYVRWNSTTGRTLATAQGPSFTVQVTIPDVGADTYTIVGVTTADNGSEFTGREAFTVTAGSGSPSDTSESTTGKEEESGGGDNSGSTSGGDGSGTRGKTEATAKGGDGGTGEGRDTVRTAGGDGSTSPDPGRSTEGAPAQPPISVPPEAPVVTTDSGREVFGGSVGPAGRNAVGPGRNDSATTRIPAREGRSEITAAGDLWSGFAAGGDGARVPGLSDAPSLSADEPSELGLGMGLLAAGLILLTAGIGVAEVRRRRALAGSSGGSR